MLSDDFMTVADISRKLGVDGSTVYAWLRDGQLRGIRLTPRGRWLVRRDEFESVFGSARR